MAHHDESSLNVHLADILSRMAPESGIRAENTGVVRESRGLKPDILVTAAGRSPVIIEAEYEPASSVEQEAKQRLGLELERQTRPVEAVVALRYPKPLEHADNIEAELNNARLSYCFFQDSGRGGGQSSMNEATRFPETGWLEGSVEDLSDLIRMISIPQKEVDRAAEALENGIEQAALLLDADSETRPENSKEIARLLGMSNVPQTRRMACAILANALTFHERIAGMHPSIRPLAVVCGRAVLDPQCEVLEVWDEILEINYYPIFAVATDILAQLPSDLAREVLWTLRRAAIGAHITNAHELTGRVFQRLISDRKYLATFYTRPHSAALLARLAVSKMRGVHWQYRESIERLKIADFACGTGALLSAVYDQIAALHERAGGTLDDLHPIMMEKVLHGADVMPSAAHIASATLSGARPDIDYKDSRIYTMPYGRQEDNTVKLGSLELLTLSSVMTLFNTTDPAKRTGRHGEETAAQINVEIKDESFDLVIMNPPFTRNTATEGAYIGTFAGAFAAFESTIDDQKDMAQRMKSIQSDTCYHGHAGMASAFASLGDRKLKPGGVLAMVLPLTAVSGQSWQKFRQMLSQKYTDIEIVSIASSGKEMSFSADTGIAECLMVARKSAPMRKHKAEKLVEPYARFISLLRSPKSVAEAAAVADQAIKSKETRRLDEGPHGGAPMRIGDDICGSTISAQVTHDGAKWGLSRIVDYSVAQTAYALSQSKLWLPGLFEPYDLKVSPLGDFADRGFHHLDIVGNPPQGPFDKLPPSPTATYPSLWNHNAQNETRMICEPDMQLQARPGLHEKAAKVWATASRCHQSLDFRYNSQPLAAAFTLRKTVGGTAWPNILFKDDRFDYAFAIWSNSVLGLLMHWWHASRQQPGRGRLTVSAAKTLPTLDLRALSDDQLSIAERIFNDFRDVEFKPAYIADLDPSRAALDHAVLCELLGFEEGVYAAVRELSAKWAAEPSVRGSKSRPAGSLAV